MKTRIFSREDTSVLEADLNTYLSKVPPANLSTIATLHACEDNSIKVAIQHTGVSDTDVSEGDYIRYQAKMLEDTSETPYGNTSAIEELINEFSADYDDASTFSIFKDNEAQGYHNAVVFYKKDLTP